MLAQLSTSSFVLNSINNTKNNISNITTQLATGKRILDPAEQGVVTRLSTQVNGFNAAASNITKSQNVINVAQTGLKAIAELLTQMKDLAGKTNDSTMSTADKAKLNQTFKSLMNQVTDLANNAAIDGVSLLGATATDVKVQTGLQSTDQITITAQKSDATSLGINTLDISATGNSASAITALQTAIDSVSTSQSSLSADNIGLKSRGSTINAVVDNLNNTIDSIQKPNMEQLQSELATLQNQQQINYYLINQMASQSQAMLAIFR